MAKVWGNLLHLLDEDYIKHLAMKAGTLLRSWDSWLVEEQEPGDNNSLLSARKVPANILFSIR